MRDATLQLDSENGQVRQEALAFRFLLTGFLELPRDQWSKLLRLFELFAYLGPLESTVAEEVKYRSELFLTYLQLRQQNGPIPPFFEAEDTGLSDEVIDLATSPLVTAVDIEECKIALNGLRLVWENRSVYSNVASPEESLPALLLAQIQHDPFRIDPLTHLLHSTNTSSSFSGGPHVFSGNPVLKDWLNPWLGEQGFLEPGSATLLIGSRNAGKTVVATDLCLGALEEGIPVQWFTNGSHGNHLRHRAIHQWYDDSDRPSFDALPDAWRSPHGGYLLQYAQSPSSLKDFTASLDAFRVSCAENPHRGSVSGLVVVDSLVIAGCSDETLMLTISRIIRDTDLAVVLSLTDSKISVSSEDGGMSVSIPDRIRDIFDLVVVLYRHKGTRAIRQCGGWIDRYPMGVREDAHVDQLIRALSYDVSTGGRFVSKD